MNKALSIAVLIIFALIGAGIFYIIYESRRAEKGQQLLEAVKNNNIETAQQLIKDGADVDFKNPKSGETPLSSAIMGGNLAMIELLLQNGAKQSGVWAPLECAETFKHRYGRYEYEKLIKLIEKYTQKK